MQTHAFFSFLLLLFMFAPDATSQTTNVAANPSYDVIPATVNRTKMLQLVNAVRRKGCQCGDTFYNPAPPLSWNTQLETAAYYHTDDMTKNKFFSHYAPDGSRGGNRLERAGYRWKTYGENIGQGYKTEKEMLDGWLASPSHCKNIMNNTFKEMGVARIGILWTQEFGSR
jgi:uncharacterized protein YkwD